MVIVLSVREGRTNLVACMQEDIVVDVDDSHNRCGPRCDNVHVARHFGGTHTKSFAEVSSEELGDGFVVHVGLKNKLQARKARL